MKLASTLAAIAIVASTPTVASAFHAAQSYTRPVSAPNGTGGIFYTGSPRSRGMTCAACHIEAAGEITLSIASEPAELAAGSYQPDTIYRVTLSLLGEHRGLSSAANENAFLADVVDGSGQPVGALEATTSSVAPAGAGVVIGRPVGGASEWTFFYRTPPSGAGALVLFASAVDGNGRDELVKAVVDPFGDDVAAFRLVACEGTSACADPLAVSDETPTSAVACRTADGHGALTFCFVLIALLLVRERKRP